MKYAELKFCTIPATIKVVFKLASFTKEPKF